MPETKVDLGFGDFVAPLGSHIASLYRDIYEMRGMTVPFIAKGLKQGDRCICVVEEESGDALQEALEWVGVDAKAALASDQMSILTTDETYVSSGYFSPEIVIPFFEKALQTAVQQGYKTIRVTGETSWALRKCPGVDRLIEYEAKVHRMLTCYPQVSLCLYNMNMFSGDIIMDTLRVHPLCIMDGVLINSPYHVPPYEFLEE